MLITAICLSYIFRKQNFFLFTSIIALLLSPIIILLFQRVPLPARALAFVDLSIPLVLCFIINWAEQVLNNYVLKTAVLVLSVLLLIISNNHPFLNWSKKFDKEAVQISDLFMHNNIKTCYDNSINSNFAYFYPALEYYYRINYKIIALNVAAENSIRYKSLEPNKYDCIVYSVKDSALINAPVNFTELYRNNEENFVIMKSN